MKYKDEIIGYITAAMLGYILIIALLILTIGSCFGIIKVFHLGNGQQPLTESAIIQVLKDGRI
jgi:hypothetical protein